MEGGKVKRCTVCGLEKALGEFYGARGRKYGVSAWCKSCKAIRAKNWRLENNKKYSGRMEGEKRCPTCRQVKKLDEFYKNSGNKYGVHCYCKLCEQKKGGMCLIRHRTVAGENKVKRCTVCRVEKKTDEFHKKNRGEYYGLVSRCKQCVSIRGKNPVTREKTLIRKQQYYRENRQKHIQAAMEYRRKTPGCRAKWKRKGVERLCNSYIKDLVSRRLGISTKDIPDELVDFYRQLIFLKRFKKENLNGKHKHGK